MIKKIFGALAIVLTVFIIMAALKPEDYLIKRDIMINAKPEAIFPHLVSTQKADVWMPWKELDPKVETKYSGPEQGVGSISSWQSTGSMGTGQAEITNVVQNQFVKTKITYTEPMEMSQEAEFILTPKAKGTLMTWTTYGKQSFIPRLMCTLMFMNMDKYVGGMFEQGLNKLKTIVESQN